MIKFASFKHLHWSRISQVNNVWIQAESFHNKNLLMTILSLQAAIFVIVRRLVAVESMSWFRLKNVFILTILSLMDHCERLTPAWWQGRNNNINKLNDIRLLMSSNMASAAARRRGMGSLLRKWDKIHHITREIWWLSLTGSSRSHPLVANEGFQVFTFTENAKQVHHL